MLHAPTVIGQASSKLSDDLKSRPANVPWRRVSAVRQQGVSAIYELEFPELSGEAQPKE